ncbi:hypothetical protein P378_19590 [Desulforamulus profundi]|uniref:Ribosomal protein L11 methyltransferase n=1 Tax=Desulforamulus profundi TaxID=1383067 RepID=A0A2C6M777_9FIRM|nr:hypothetical protein P378_19590 [Desulforamulus profundi]
MNWLEIAVHVPHEGIDMVSNIFDELGAGGVVIEDPALISRYIEANIWDHYEFPPEVLNRPMPMVKAYLPEGPELEDKLVLLQERLAGLPLGSAPKVETARVAEEDWATAWMAYYKPVEIGRKLAVKPAGKNIPRRTVEWFWNWTPAWPLAAVITPPPPCAWSFWREL